MLRVRRMNAGRTVVVVAHHGIGDLLMTLPLLRNCRAALGEEDRLVVLVKSELEAQVVNSVPWTGRVLVWPGEMRGVIRRVRTGLVLRAMRPDALLAPMFVDRLQNVLWIRLVGACKSVGPGGKWARLGYGRSVEAQPGMHKVERFVQCGVEAGFPRLVDPDVTVPISEERKAKARAMMPGWRPDQQWIAFGPGSGVVEAHKRWPIERFRTLAGMLLEHSRGVRIVVFGSAAERELLESVVRCADFDVSRCVVFAGSDFQSSIALLSQCHCMVSGCSGAAHMAAAAGTWVVGLYGPTNPGGTGPAHGRLRVVRAGLTCSPCYRVGFVEGCGDPVCMSLIRPEAVFKAIVDSLNGIPAPAVPWLETTRSRKPSRCMDSPGV
jgi:ADP-heptose:LPS heptosyltransferase